ncbi:MAG TPA: MFS transporter [Natronosporangium sp.]|nr:MFS transporter [Natronosporangium sp.]
MPRLTDPAPAAPPPGVRRSVGRPTPAAPRRPAADRLTGLVLIVGVVLVGLNLRAAVTSLGALLEDVSTAFGWSGSVAGVVTMLPTLSFAVFGAVAPWMTRRVADARILVAAMVLLAGGLLARAATGSTAVFLLCTAVALSGIAVANVLLPSLVKQRFPGHVGLMTGVYTVALIISTAGGSAATVPVAELGGSWRVGLGAWALLAAVAALSWLPAAVAGRAGTGPVATGGGTRTGGAGGTRTGGAGGARTGGAVPLGGAQAVAPGADTPTGTAAATGATAAVGRVRVRPWRSGLGWAMAVFFGAQSLVAYAIMGWLAQLYRDAGFTPASAGLVVAFVNGLGVPGALVVATATARLSDPRPLVVGLGTATTVGFLGVLVAPGPLVVLWVLVLAAGQATLPFALAMIALRARTPEGTVALSAFSQSVGYLIAGFGPLTVGILYDLTGGWVAPVTSLIAVVVVQTVAGLVLTRPRYIEDG